MNVRFLLEADADLEAARSWYEGERTGLGLEFVSEIHAVLRGVKAFPYAASPVGKGVRVVRPRRFPYGVYYQVIDEEIIVIGIFHLKRRPSLWKKRLGH